VLVQAMQQLADAFGQVADQAERIQQRPRITLEVVISGGSDRARAEELERNLTPQYVAALSKKLGLDPAALRKKLGLA
jgi:hypothetical protein